MEITKKLEMPYNLSPDCLNLYKAWHEYIEEIYFMAPREIFPTARQYEKYPSLEEYTKQIKDIITTGLKYDMRTMMLLNGVKYLNTEEIKVLLDYLEEQQRLGLSGVVVADPMLGEIIHEYVPKLKIRYSILSLASSINKIKEIEYLGYVKEICLPQTVNRDEDYLKLLKKEFPNIGFSTIINVSCKADCPLFFWHQAFYNSQDETEINHSLTYMDYRKAKQNIIEKCFHNNLANPFILPSEIHRYKDYFSQFKLEDRVLPTYILESFLIHYALEIDPVCLSDIITGVCQTVSNKDIKLKYLPKKQVEYWRTCKNECWKCHRCEALLKEMLKKEEEATWQN